MSTAAPVPLLPELCDLLRQSGIRVHLGDQSGRCFAHPPSKLTPTIIAGLKKYKLELVAALKRRHAPIMLAPEACARCGSDVVFSAGEKCSPCSMIAQTIEVEPGSQYERELLAALENNRRNPSENV